MDKVSKANNTLSYNKQLGTNYDFVCGGLKVSVSNSQSKTRLRVYIQKTGLGNFFFKEFDVTRRDSDGQIVEKNKIDLAPGERPSEAEIIQAFDYYYDIARDKVCRNN